MNRARFLAYRSLVAGLKEKRFSHRENDSVLESTALSPEDRALYSQLYFGVIEKKITLDYILSQISTYPLNECTPQTLALLELGAYQILYLDRIPHRAAVHETVEIAKKESKGSAGFVNAVLRALIQKKDRIPQMLALSGKKGLAIRYGYHKALISLWQNAYGKERCEKILIAQNHPAPLTLRIHTGKTSLEEYEAKLSEKGIPFHRNPLTRYGITLEKSVSPNKLPGYEEGLFFIQDAAAQHAVDRLSFKPGERVLDLCAAPGGKSFAAALDMKETGSVVSQELSPIRAKMIEKNARRLEIQNLTVEIGDSSHLRPQWKGEFHRVICDVPCSGFGTIAKKPDIRHKDVEEIRALPPLQGAILEAGAEALMPGGRILYSTCTLNPKENEEITDAFLERHKDFIRIGEKETIFPVGGENDGFFCDILEKLI